MNRIAMSPAGLAVLRALVGRAGVSRDRILLSDSKSVEWNSLTFTGERHQLELRVPGPDSMSVVQRMCDGLEDAEFNLRGIIVADIAVSDGPQQTPDGSVTLTVEALTVADD
jgi:hypothetical protein